MRRSCPPLAGAASEQPVTKRAKNRIFTPRWGRASNVCGAGTARSRGIANNDGGHDEMSSLTARRVAWACALSVACSTALVATGLASAEPGGEQCSGESNKGKGASLQKLAQIEIWNPDFNKGANPLACSGTQGSKGEPKVEYTSTGSGAFLRSW